MSRGPRWARPRWARPRWDNTAGGRPRTAQGPSTRALLQPAAAKDRGSATMWSLSIIILLTAAMMLALALAAAVIQRHRATSAADMAALAGAGQLIAGPAAACGRAAEVARRHSAVLESCDVIESSVTVEVSLPHQGQVLAPARGRARAGVGP